MFDFGSLVLHPGTQVEADAPNSNSKNHGKLQYQELDMNDETDLTLRMGDYCHGRVCPRVVLLPFSVPVFHRIEGRSS